MKRLNAVVEKVLRVLILLQVIAGAVWVNQYVYQHFSQYPEWVKQVVFWETIVITMYAAHRLFKRQ